MDVGIYSNLFQVHWGIQDAELMKVERSNFPDLRDLRKQIRDKQIDAQVYALDKDVYGYGQQQVDLEKFGFVKEDRHLDLPELVSRLILEGFVDSLTSAGYSCNYMYGKAIAFQLNTPLLTLPNGVNLFRGAEICSQFLFDQENENVAYFIIVDPRFKYTDQTNRALNTQELVSKYGSATLKQLRTKQGDFAPSGGINLEVSRQRLADFILPFIDKRHEFTLPCWALQDGRLSFGILAQIELNPIRVILAE